MPGFDIGHLALFAAIALLVFGPQRLQEIMRTVGRTVDEFRRASQGLPPVWSETATSDGAESQNTIGNRESFEGPTMTLMEHIGELRSRIVRAAIPIGVAAAICFYFSDWLLALIKAPAGPGFQINAFGPMDGFAIRWKVALYGGLVLAVPFWLYEILAFTTPALTPRERRFFFPILAAIIVLFLMGVAFGFFMLSSMLRVMFNMFGTQIIYLPNATQYISFVVFFTLACGLVFEMPAVLLVLVRIGILKVDTLRRQRKIAYFALFVFAEVITPVADPFLAPLIVMTPLVILYEAAIFCSRFILPRPETESAPSGAGR
jgi:sec-independent protein translocase protein TatC